MLTSSNCSKSARGGQGVGEGGERKFEVICRVRPLQQAESSEDIAIGEGVPTITIFNHLKNNSKEFTFHRVYGQTVRQLDFSLALVDQIYLNCTINGKGCLVLSYGVTNSGKTYTILGTDKEPGLLPALINKFEREMPNEKIRIRAMEVYTDEVYCLRRGEKLQMKEGWNGYEFVGCDYEPITKANASQVISIFTRNRRAAETHSNSASSRSHAIFMVQCGNYHLGITDLAGNERYGTNANFQETFSINKNLLVLGKCIHAFRDGQRMPFRECKLTLALVEYFKPSYKIYMIAHLNRSGQMFHQNVNVLEYAAVSTQVRHLNLIKNPSIAKSIKKRRDKQTSIIQLSQQKPHTDDDLAHRHNRILLEKYKCYIMGVNAQADEDLDRYFHQQDAKDQQFLADLKQKQFVSPQKDRRVWLDKLEAESRIKLREIFRSEMRAGMEEKETGMGPSMRKYYQQSGKRMVECSTMMGSSMKKSPFKPSLQSVNGSAEDEVVTTPIKPISGAGVESESYIKRVMKNPTLMIQSGFRMISNFNQVATNMVESFKGLLKQQEVDCKNGNPPKPEERADVGVLIKKITHLAIQPQSGMKIVFNPRSSIHIPELAISESERESQQQSQVQKFIETKQTEYKQEPKSQQHNPIPFDSQESTILIHPHQASPQGEQETQPQPEMAYNGPKTAQFNHIPNIEQSMLLDGFRSEKDLSTNRTSQVDLLKSQQSLKALNRPPFQSIPEVIQSETASKMPFSHLDHNKNNIFARQKQNKKIPNVHTNHKFNDTGFKSTQQTLNAHSHNKLNKSHSQPKVNKSASPHHYKTQNISYHKKLNHEIEQKDRSMSRIKTRNQRKNKNDKKRGFV